MKIPKLMLITPGDLMDNPRGLELIKYACRMGIQGLQIREKRLDDRSLWNLAENIREMTAEHGIFLTVNERMDIAVSIKADGVHLPEEGVSPYIPKKLRPSFNVGVSTHSLENAMRAEQEGADYVLFGPIFPTPSKMPYGSPQGLRNLKIIAHKLTIPVIAVGGIVPSNAMACMQAGAYGVAAIGAFFGQLNNNESIDLTIHQFLKELNCIR